MPPEDGGLYSLFFANCMQPHVVVTMTIYSEMYNLLPGGGKDYLSAGDAPLPVLFTVMAVFFFVAALAWAWVLYTNRATAHKVHYLMLALVFFKALSTMSQAGMKHMQRTTGNSEGWNIAYYVFSLFRGTLLFTTIFLLGTGWSFLKPFLSDREKKVICAVLPLQVLANVASIVLDEEGPAQWGWFTARDIFHLLDIICCCAILFPIVWSIKQLRESAHTDGKAARNLHKLTLFRQALQACVAALSLISPAASHSRPLGLRPLSPLSPLVPSPLSRQFYVMVVSYIYFTRIVVYLLKSTTPYQLTWLADAAEQVATLAFYCFTGFKFRPVGNNPYFHLEMDELDESEQELVRREVAENVRDAAK